MKANYENHTAVCSWCYFLRFQTGSFICLLFWHEGATSTSLYASFPLWYLLLSAQIYQWTVATESNSFLPTSLLLDGSEVQFFPQEHETTKVKTWRSLSAWFLCLTPALRDSGIRWCLWGNFKKKLGSGDLFPAGIFNGSWPMAMWTSVSFWICLLVSMCVTWSC